MREQDVLTRDTWMLVAEIKRYEIDNKTSANEEDILKIKKMLKQEKIQSNNLLLEIVRFTDKEKQKKVIDKYMPEQCQRTLSRKLSPKLLQTPGQMVRKTWVKLWDR